MNPKIRTYSGLTKEALVLLGQQVKLARKTHHMPQKELANRVGIARSTLQRIENGDPLVEIGLVFEAATLAGVPLFGAENDRLRAHSARLEDKLALLPKSIRQPRKPVHDDF